MSVIPLVLLGSSFIASLLWWPHIPGRPAVPPRLVADVPPASSVRPEVGYPLRLTCPIEGTAAVRWLRNRRPITERDGVIFDGRLGLIVLR